MEPAVPAAAAAAPASAALEDGNNPTTPILDDRIAACYDECRQITGDAIVVPTAKRTRGKVRDCWEPILLETDTAAAAASRDGVVDDQNVVTTTPPDTTTTNRHVLAMVTTDRQSGFDRQLAVVPFKGAVLNLCSQFWFERTADLVPNHLLAVPHPSVSIVRRCRPFSIEFVVRYVFFEEYAAGSKWSSCWRSNASAVDLVLLFC
jgi:phosphoribosylaminoimidazole-succinocarboxamide synthase